MKKITLIISILFAFAISFGQVVKQNTEFQRIAMFSGKPIVQDTSLWIKSGNDTIRITNYGDTSRFTTTAGGGFDFSPKLDFNQLASLSTMQNMFALQSADKGIIFIKNLANFTDNILSLGDFSSFGAGSFIFDYKGQYFSVSTNEYIALRGRELYIESDSFVNVTNKDRFLRLDNFGLSYSKNGDSLSTFRVDTLGYLFTGNQNDSVSIYARTDIDDGTQVFCKDCSGNGITGRILAYVGGLWRRLKFD